jgi:hypothetical protein
MKKLLFLSMLCFGAVVAQAQVTFEDELFGTSSKSYSVQEVQAIIEKWHAVPFEVNFPKNTSNDNGRILVSSQGYMYCNGQCFAIVNIYSYNLFGVTLWTKTEIYSQEGCPCGDFK